MFGLVSVMNAHLPRHSATGFAHPASYPTSNTVRNSLLYCIAVLSACAALPIYLPFPVLSSLARSLGLDPDQRDVILGGFTALLSHAAITSAAFIAGYLADHYHRTPVLFTVCAVSGAATAAISLARSFPAFAALRMLSVAANGAITPIAFSLIGDLYLPVYRARALLLVNISEAFGAALGELTAVLVSHSLSWHAAFSSTGLFAVLVTAILSTVACYEPARGLNDFDDASAAAPDSASACELAPAADTDLDPDASAEPDHTPATARAVTAIVLLHSALAMLPWSVFSIFAFDHIRTDAHEDDAAASALIYLWGISANLGKLLGAFATERLLRTGRLLLLPPIAALAGVLAAPLAIVSFSLPFSAYTIALASLAALAQGAVGPITNTILINHNPPDRRGLVGAALEAADAVGAGLLTWLLSLLMPVLGRTPVITLAFSAWLLCALLMLPLRAALARKR